MPKRGRENDDGVSSRAAGKRKQRKKTGPKYDDYIVENRLGEGTYGTVSKARHKVTKEIVAIKTIKMEESDEGIPATALREIAVLNRLKQHPSVVDLKAQITEEGKLYLVFEYMDMDLKKYIETYRDRSEKEMKRLMRALLEGVDFCISKGILHRDLKPQNILVDEKGTLKIADYGLGREVGLAVDELTHEVVTLWYRCPEILLGTKRYGIGVDSWSIGCIMAELFQSVPIFQGDSEIDQIFKIFQLLGTPDETTWKNVTDLKDFSTSFPKWRPLDLIDLLSDTPVQAGDLIRSLLYLDPAKRISPLKALQHEWFVDGGWTNMGLAG